MIINYTETKKNYVENQLIAYIGNKRRLLPLIQKAFELIELNPKEEHPIFYDPFAGSGVISRFAKTLGFKVIANDWEKYSQIINKAFLEIDESEVDSLYISYGGLENLLTKLNNLPPLKEEESYISRYYCPKDTNKPDLKNERLFYSRENGEKIDAIRKAIDNLPLNGDYKANTKRKNLLLALLLYESSTRSNTSGVFKAFHKGFGGTGKDALGRILKPLSLIRPNLYNSSSKNKVFKTCANKLTKKLSPYMRFDVTYLDPPYNQHQYGSNYHLLNTIAYNDRPPVNETVYINGRKIHKSAIRKDWIKTRSSYCYKSTATSDFKHLVDNLNSHYIIVSYSIDGIIPFDDMLNILSKKGELSIVTAEYTKYRGGKQALTTEKNNIEFLLLVNTERPSSQNDIIKIKEKLLDQKIQLYIKKNIDYISLFSLDYEFYQYNQGVKIYRKNFDQYSVRLYIENDYGLSEPPRWQMINNSESTTSTIWRTLPYEIKIKLEEDLSYVTSITKDREIEIILKLIENIIRFPLPSQLDEKKSINSFIINFYKKIPILLKKFNNKKAYLQSLKTIGQIIETTSLIKKNCTDLYFSSSFQTKLNQIKKIIEDKINHQSDQLEMETQFLKSTIKDKYFNFLGAA